MLDPKNLKPGEEQHEYHTDRVSRVKKKYCGYDYRHSNGELFSCVKKNLEECRAARDVWLQESKGERG